MAQNPKSDSQSEIATLQKKIKNLQKNHNAERQEWADKVDKLQGEVYEIAKQNQMIMDLIQDLHPSKMVSSQCKEWEIQYDLKQQAIEAQTNWENQIEDMPVHTD